MVVGQICWPKIDARSGGPCQKQFRASWFRNRRALASLSSHTLSTSVDKLTFEYIVDRRPLTGSVAKLPLPSHASSRARRADRDVNIVGCDARVSS